MSVFTDTLAMSFLSCVPAFVEPCDSNKGFRVGASVDHTSVPTQGNSGQLGERGEGGGGEGRGGGEGSVIGHSGQCVQMGFILGV